MWRKADRGWEVDVMEQACAAKTSDLDRLLEAFPQIKQVAEMAAKKLVRDMGRIDELGVITDPGFGRGVTEILGAIARHTAPLVSA